MRCSAAAAFPDRQVVAFVGDGGLTMLMGELATCEKYALNVKVVAIKKLPRRRFLYLSWHCHSSGRVPDSKVIG